MSLVELILLLDIVACEFYEDDTAVLNSHCISVEINSMFTIVMIILLVSRHLAAACALLLAVSLQ